MYAGARQTLWVGVALAALLTVGPARAQQPDDKPPTLTGAGELPFSDVQLQQALLARLLPSPSEPGPPRAQVEPAGPGVVSVRVGDRKRTVTVGDRTGTAAARVVALVIADLLTAGPPSDETASGAPQHQSVEIATLPAATAEIQPVVPEARRRWRLVVAGGASKGTGASELVAGALNADLVVAPRNGRFKLAPSLGFTMMPTRNAGMLDEVSFWGVAARMLAGFSHGPVDVLGGPIASAYAIGGATTHSGFLFGGEVMARVAAPLSRRVRLAVDARADAWANRVRVHWVTPGTYATPRVGLGIDVGLAWDWPS